MREATTGYELAFLFFPDLLCGSFRFHHATHPPIFSCQKDDRKKPERRPAARCVGRDVHLNNDGMQPLTLPKHNQELEFFRRFQQLVSQTFPPASTSPMADSFRQHCFQVPCPRHGSATASATEMLRLFSRHVHRVERIKHVLLLLLQSVSQLCGPDGGAPVSLPYSKSPTRLDFPAAGPPSSLGRGRQPEPQQ
jgi:hypothetical protein